MKCSLAAVLCATSAWPRSAVAPRQADRLEPAAICRQIDQTSPTRENMNLVVAQRKTTSVKAFQLGGAEPFDRVCWMYGKAPVATLPAADIEWCGPRRGSTPRFRNAISLQIIYDNHCDLNPGRSTKSWNDTNAIPFVI